MKAISNGKTGEKVTVFASVPATLAEFYRAEGRRRLLTMSAVIREVLLAHARASGYTTSADAGVVVEERAAERFD